MSDVVLLLLAGTFVALISSVVWACCWMLVKALQVLFPRD